MSGRNYGLVKPRKDLDKIVLDNAEAAGRKVLYNTQAIEPIFDDGVLTAFVAKREGEGRDPREVDDLRGGSGDEVRPLAGPRPRPRLPDGIRDPPVLQVADASTRGWFEAYLDVKPDRGTLPGYGWVFPVGDGTVNVGVGLLSTFGGWRDVNLHHLQDATSSRNFPPEWEINPETVCIASRAPVVCSWVEACGRRTARASSSPAMPPG